MKIDNKKLKHCREEAGFTQKDMAKKIGVSNISYQYYEMGIRNPKKKTLKRIELILETKFELSDKEKIELLINSISDNMREIKGVTEIDDVENMTVCEIVAKLESMLQSERKCDKWKDALELIEKY